MPFELKNTVPWGRTLKEYQNIFNLTESDLDKEIISFGDGPPSFNSEMKKNNERPTMAIRNAGNYLERLLMC
tara:strand:- start:2516 stop:2731 length:216 start_codon:yes stop_codon:yes gene_type:complete